MVSHSGQVRFVRFYKSLDEILQSNESSSAVFSSGNVCLLGFYKINFNFDLDRSWVHYWMIDAARDYHSYGVDLRWGEGVGAFFLLDNDIPVKFRFNLDRPLLVKIK